ncbi:MAG: DUF6768 family protein [Wenzhouxiangellaceae bacterium]
MNIDERIRKELHDQGNAVEQLPVEEKGLFGMLFRVFTGGLARWAAFGMVMTLIFTGLTVWCGYEFFTAASVDDRVFWGVLAAIAFHAVSMFKFWFFMEMNRHSITREVKRVEIALERLKSSGNS